MYEALKSYIGNDLAKDIEDLATSTVDPRPGPRPGYGPYPVLRAEVRDRFEATLSRARATVENAETEKGPGHQVQLAEAKSDLDHFAHVMGSKFRRMEEADEAALTARAERARTDAEWRASDERKQSQGVLYIGAALCFLGIAMVLYLIGFGIRYGLSSANLLFGVISYLLIAAGWVLMWSSPKSGRKALADKKLLAELNAGTVRTAQALSEAVDDPTKLIEYWNSTQQRLDKFHADARGQLHSAYLLSQGSAVLGFVVVLTLGVVAALSPSTTSTIVVGGVAAIGAALSAYVSHTFQVTYDRALRQTMTYFEQPVIASRLLHGERLLTQFKEDSEAREEALLVMIRAITTEDSTPPSG